MPREEVIDGEKFNKLPLVSQFDELTRAYDTMLDHNCEPQFLQFALIFEECRKKWLLTEDTNNELIETLTKLQAEKDALIVKLRLARQQITEELNGKKRAEQERDDLEQQIILVRELLYNDSNATHTLSEEQQRKLDFLNQTRYRSPRGKGRRDHRLQPIDETGSFLDDSDISFDETTEDLDSSQPSSRRGKRSHAAAQQRALMAAGMLDESRSKRIKADDTETIHCMIDGPAILEVKKLDKSFNRPSGHQGRRRPSREHRRKSNTVALASTTETDTGVESDVQNFWPDAPLVSARMQTPVKKLANKHNLVAKQCVIVKEVCKPCGKRIPFGKKAMKCSNCRIVAHSECEKKLKDYTCESRSPSSERSTEKTTVADYLHSTTSPQIPPIIYYSIQEIERRGMKETGLYRIPGSLREVRELRTEFLKGNVPKLQDDVDIHALCSLVKEFFRSCLKEPVLTYSLRPEFVRAAKAKEQSGIKEAINELPSANRDTLVYLMMHLQRVVDSTETRMSVEALSKAISPSIVCYASPDPAYSDLQFASKEQEIVLTELLGLPSHYYRQLFDNAMRFDSAVSSTPESNLGADNMLGPVYSPKKTQSSSSLAERAKRYLGTPFGKSKRKEAYFQSPTSTNSYVSEQRIPVEMF